MALAKGNIKGKAIIKMSLSLKKINVKMEKCKCLNDLWLLDQMFL